jgi:methyl-accepting chemotaxis protein
MEHELITPEEIATLPDDDSAAFVKFESICRRRMQETISRLGQDASEDDFRLEYMGRVYAAGIEFSVPGAENLNVPATGNYQPYHYRNFSQDVLGIVTQLQIRSVRRAKEMSVELHVNDKRKIQHHIQQIRSRIDSTSDLDEHKKRALHKKLDALAEELNGKRLNFARTMVIVASIAAAVSQTESAIIKAPETISTIMEIIGSANELEESQRRLPRPEKPLAIESKRQKMVTDGAHFARDLDDEIPF